MKPLQIENTTIRQPEFVGRLRRWPKFIKRSDLEGWALCLPAFALFAVFVLGPALTGLVVSLNDWDGFSRGMQFVGLANYAELFTTPRFWRSLGITFLFAFLNLIVKTSFAFGLALLMSQRLAGMRLYRNATFVPQALSIAAVALIWKLVYDPYRGLINGLISLITTRLGLGDFVFGWLGNPNTALLSVLTVVTWYYFGLHMIIFMAALASIPSEYYDAAKIETSSWFATLRYITLPLLREVFLIIFVMTMAGSFGQLFGIFLLLTGGGPAGRTEHVGIHMIKSAFDGYRYGYASAVSVVMVVIVALIVLGPAMHMARERLEY